VRARSEAPGNLDRGGDVRPRGGPGEQALFARDAPGHDHRIGARNRHNFVDQGRVPQRGRVADADAFDLVRAGLAAAAVRRHDPAQPDHRGVADRRENIHPSSTVGVLRPRLQ
jgi:hypothetical protein